MYAFKKEGGNMDYCSLILRVLLVTPLYRMSQEEMSIFWEATVSVIISKKVYMYMYMCSIPNGFRDGAISLYTVQLSNSPAMSSHELNKWTDVDGEIFENVLY
jgi:hypothetical protein